MKLYKLRPLTNLERVLDIVVNERLYCAHFEDLNDPFEGVYLTYGSVPPSLSSPVWSEYRSKRDVSDLDDVEKHSQICSLSESFADLRLWSYYADGHRGVAIEIDFSEFESDICPIDYVTELKKYSNTVIGTPTPDEVLTKKTIHWNYEKEYRILQAGKYYPISGRVTGVYLGGRVTDDNINMLSKVLPNEVPLICTKINEKTLDVEASSVINR